MSSVCYCLMPRPMGLQPCPQDSDWCSWRKAGRPAQGGKVGPGQALCGGWRSMADTRGRFSRGGGEVAPESDPGPQGRAGLCLGSSWSPSEVSFQVCPPGVFLQVSPSRRVLQVSSSRHALQACPPGVLSRRALQVSSSRHALQASSSRCSSRRPPRNPARGHSPTKDATTERQHSHLSQVLGHRATGRSRWRTRWSLQGVALTWVDRLSLQAA